MPMFSQTTEYAIRAMIEIARLPEGESVLVRELTERVGIPQFYLAKILHQLARVRLLKSVRGRGGGFRLAKPADGIPLRAVVAPFEDVEKTTECILGRTVCSDIESCPLHAFWKDVRERYVCELETKTLGELARHDDLWRSPFDERAGAMKTGHGGGAAAKSAKKKAAKKTRPAKASKPKSAGARASAT
jgi:Rrf2 family iron-sulfur cluster assembly transcriptional regulator